MKIILLSLFLCLTFSAYNQSLASLAASYCGLIHCPRSSVDAWSCKLCQTTQPLTDNKLYHNVGLIGYNSIINAVVVSWRGSIDIRNYIEDANFEFTDYSRCKNCKVHLGFNFAYKAIEKQLIDHVDKLLAKNPSASIFVSGHSLGGAMATISAVQLQLKYNKVSSLYAFGCPRIGNDHFSQYVNLKVPERYRVIHNRDLFAHVPYEAMGYHHYSRQVLYDQNFVQYKICNESGEDSSCSNSYFPNYVASDHDLYFVMMDQSVC